MKYLYTLSIMLLLGISTVFSQDAKTILDNLANNSNSYETMQGDFEYKLENTEANVYENSNGSFQIKGDKYKIKVLGTETYFNGENLYSYIVDVNEVSIQEPEDDDEDFLKPSNLFTIYKKGYDYKYVGKIIDEGRTVHIIDLLPKKDEQSFKKLVMKIDKTTNNLVSMKTIGKSGDNVEIRITTFETNEPINDSTFTFKESNHPNVEVIDMR